MYSIFCAVAVVFVITVVPETKGRDLDDIAKLFVKNGRSGTSNDTQAETSARALNEVWTDVNSVLNTNGEFFKIII